MLAQGSTKKLVAGNGADAAFVEGASEVVVVVESVGVFTP
jgi:hypothetical protein